MSLFIDKLGELLEMGRLEKLLLSRKKNRTKTTQTFPQDVLAQ
jgi:hypothetical protein